MSILVLGATGNVGPHVVAELRAASIATRVITRNADAAAAKLPTGTEVVEGDLGDDATLARAVQGIESVFLLTPHSYTMGELQLRVIRALRRTDVRIVKLSGTNSAIRPDGPHACRQHWEVEQVLAACGQPHVIVRPNSFMQVLIGQIMVPALQATGRIPNAIGSAGLSFIDARDVGAVAAAVLVRNDWDGQTLVLTGPRAVTYAEIAAQLSQLRGESITTVEITPADARATLLARGLEEWEAGHFEEMYQLFRDGKSEFVTDTVQEVTGRAPRTVEAYLAELAEGSSSGSTA